MNADIEQSSPDTKKTMTTTRVLASIVIILSIILVILIWENQKTSTQIVIVYETIPQENEGSGDEIISYQELETDAYQITYPEINTDSELINTEVEQYINNRVEEFQIFANQDRVGAVAEFGELPEFLKRPYVLDIKAKFSNGESIDSLVLSNYQYSGGANGNADFKTFVVLNEDRVVNFIGEIIPINNRQEAKEIIVKALENMTFEDIRGSEVLFPNALRDLDLNDVQFSITNDSNIMLYFDEYQVGPGVIGAFSIDISNTNLFDLTEL